MLKRQKIMKKLQRMARLSWKKLQQMMTRNKSIPRVKVKERRRIGRTRKRIRIDLLFGLMKTLSIKIPDIVFFCFKVLISD